MRNKFGGKCACGKYVAPGEGFVSKSASGKWLVDCGACGASAAPAAPARPRREYLWKALRVGRYGGYDVVGFKEAPRNSVLSGQTLTCFIDNYASEAEARAAHPDAEGFTSGWTGPQVSVSHLPGEDDPVPGGMYPDDI